MMMNRQSPFILLSVDLNQGTGVSVMVKGDE